MYTFPYVYVLETNMRIGLMEWEKRYYVYIKDVFQMAFNFEIQLILSASEYPSFSKVNIDTDSLHFFSSLLIAFTLCCREVSESAPD